MAEALRLARAGSAEGYDKAGTIQMWYPRPSETEPSFLQRAVSDLKARAQSLLKRKQTAPAAQRLPDPMGRPKKVR
jgi:hypothetical protein